jgi:hypothetical protein
LAALMLEGSVQQRLVLNKALLESFSPVTVDATFEADEGKKSGRHIGVLLGNNEFPGLDQCRTTLRKACMRPVTLEGERQA